MPTDPNDPALIEINAYWRQLYQRLGAGQGTRPGVLLDSALGSNDPDICDMAETLLRLLSEATIGRATGQVASGAGNAVRLKVRRSKPLRCLFCGQEQDNVLLGIVVCDQCADRMTAQPVPVAPKGTVVPFPTNAIGKKKQDAID